MRSSMLVAIATALLVFTASPPVAAHEWGHGGHWHHGWHRHHHGHGQFFLGLNFGGPLFGPYPSYYEDYEPPPAVIFRPAPTVVYQQPVPVAPRVPAGCREFQSRVTIAGHLQNAWGIACPQADGSWHILN